MAVVTLGTTGAAHPVQRIAARLKAAATAMRAVIDSYVSYRMQTSASQAEHIRQSETMIAAPSSSGPAGNQNTRSRWTCRMKQSARYNRSTPAPSATSFRHSSSGVTTTASGWCARPRVGSAEFSCSRIQRPRLPAGTAGRRGAQLFFQLSGSNSTLQTAAIRSPHSLDNCCASRGACGDPSPRPPAPCSAAEQQKDHENDHADACPRSAGSDRPAFRPTRPIGNARRCASWRNQTVLRRRAYGARGDSRCCRGGRAEGRLLPFALQLLSGRPGAKCVPDDPEDANEGIGIRDGATASHIRET
jgi:hypothetical protein